MKGLVEFVGEERAQSEIKFANLARAFFGDPLLKALVEERQRMLKSLNPAVRAIARATAVVDLGELHDLMKEEMAVTGEAHQPEQAVPQVAMEFLRIIGRPLTVRQIETITKWKQEVRLRRLTVLKLATEGRGPAEVTNMLFSAESARDQKRPTIKKDFSLLKSAGLLRDGETQFPQKVSGTSPDIV